MPVITPLATAKTPTHSKQNVEKVINAAKSIVSRANEAEIFTRSKPNSPTTKAVINDARNWVLNIEDNVDRFSAGDALVIVSGLFDIIHRIAFNRPSRLEFVNKYILKALDAKIDGDTTVDEYDLFRAIDAGINRHDKAYSGKAMQWHSLSISRWYRQLKSGSETEHFSDYDIIQQLSLLIMSDLYAFEGSGQDSFKRHLIYKHKHYLENQTAFQTDPKTSNALHHLRLSTLSQPDLPK